VWQSELAGPFEGAGPRGDALWWPFSSWAPTSPHGKAARIIVRPASAELKPSGKGPRRFPLGESGRQVMTRPLGQCEPAVVGS